MTFQSKPKCSFASVSDLGLGEPSEAMEVVLETISDSVNPLLVSYQSAETSDVAEADNALSAGKMEHHAWSQMTPRTSSQESTSDEVPSGTTSKTGSMQATAAD